MYTCKMNTMVISDFALDGRRRRYGASGFVALVSAQKTHGGTRQSISVAPSSHDEPSI